MSRGIVLQPEALADIDEAAGWYNAERPGLGGEFLDILFGLYERIADNPLQFPVVEHGTRRALFERFPYAVYFIIESDRVVVRAVLHLHRHPDTWKRRG